MLTLPEANSENPVKNGGKGRQHSFPFGFKGLFSGAFDVSFGVGICEHWKELSKVVWVI